MAHDFSITKEETNETAMYFGLSGGFYEAFNADKFNAGISGSNEGKSISKKEALSGVELMLKCMGNDSYFKYDFEKFKKIIEASDNEQLFFVHFS